MNKIQILDNERLSFGDYNIVGMESGLCEGPDLTLLDNKYTLVISHEPDLWDYYAGSLRQRSSSSNSMAGFRQLEAPFVCHSAW